MKIEINKIPGMKKGEYCYVHARGAMNDKGTFIITMQPLRLSGSDVFYGMLQTKSTDYGETWSDITECKNLKRRSFKDGMEYCICDATPMYHKKTGKFLMTGHTAVYLNDNLAPDPRPIHTPYAIYDETSGEWSDFKILEIPNNENDDFYQAGSGCAQCVELEDGDILVPVYHASKKAASDSWNSSSLASVLRCGFDGENLFIKEIGNSMTTDVPRGFGEPSVVRSGDEFFLALRNDVTGFIAKSEDGLFYDEPKELVFDNGENVGNYNTQQHWVTLKDKLYLVYTRRGADNDHIFRHRAPLFIAEYDTKRMCLIRDTEKIVVPERGARLGNFGCFNVNDSEAYVIDAEWMQCNNGGTWNECAERGSDNSIFITKVTL